VLDSTAPGGIIRAADDHPQLRGFQPSGFISSIAQATRT
jgi:hypothetical protein